MVLIKPGCGVGLPQLQANLLLIALPSSSVERRPGKHNPDYVEGCMLLSKNHELEMMFVNFPCFVAGSSMHCLSETS